MNGNPGDHELYWGELDDARAAVAWLQAQPEVDAQRVYVFGHSAGGVLSGLLSLCETPRVKLTGSAGGTYDERLFQNMPQRLPFETSKQEQRLRLFSPNAALIQQPHVAYVGEKDILARRPRVEAARDRSWRS